MVKLNGLPLPRCGYQLLEYYQYEDMMFCFADKKKIQNNTAVKPVNDTNCPGELLVQLDDKINFWHKNICHGVSIFMFLCYLGENDTM